MEIPKTFYDFEGNPFSECKVCGAELLESGRMYMIEKAVKVYPDNLGETVVFEHAICLACADEMSNQLSKDSREAVQKYFQQVAQQLQTEAFLNDEEIQVNSESCLVSKKPVSACTEYQRYATCKGDKLFEGAQPPFALSGEVMEEIQDLLSEETRDFLDNFMETHFGIPPEWEGKPSPRPLLI